MLVAAVDDEEVAILHAGVEMHAVVGQMLVEETDEHVALLGLEAAAGVVLEYVALDAHKVAAKRKVAGLQFHADAGGFEWAAALVDKVLVLAEDAAAGYL